jgi:two-component system invasion response regulator UvrY
MTAANPIRILIADDHSVFRHGLRDILARHFLGAEFGEANTAQGALEQVWKQPWSVVVLDVSMPGRSGVEVLKEIKSAQPRLPVLMLSMHPEDQYAVRVLQAGAAGYVTKLGAPQELVQAIEKVLSGGKYISPATAEKLVNRMHSGAGLAPHEKLSNREFQILRLLASGKPVKAIAADLSVSVQTVSTHRTRTLKKLGLRTTSELIRYAMDHRLE